MQGRIPIPYKKILVPHDGSEMSDHTFKHALYLAKLSGAQLVILHVIESEAIPPSVLLTFIRLSDRSSRLIRETAGSLKSWIPRRAAHARQVPGPPLFCLVVSRAGAPPRVAPFTSFTLPRFREGPPPPMATGTFRDFYCVPDATGRAATGGAEGNGGRELRELRRSGRLGPSPVRRPPGAAGRTGCRR